MKSLIWRLRNISLFLLAYSYGIIRGKRDKKLNRAPRKIVIIQGARLGDMVCTTPVFRAIKEKYPSCEVIVVGDSVNQKLIEGHPHVDRYIIWKNNFREVLSKIREEQADFGIVCLPSLEGLALLLLGNVGLIASPKIDDGKSPYETSTYVALLTLVETVPHYFDHYVPREYLRLLEPIGIETQNIQKSLTFTTNALERVKEIFKANGINEKEKLVGILPGVGGDPIKLWAPEKFSKIADYVFQKYNALPIIIGSDKDADAVVKTVSCISPKTKTVNLLNLLTIDELKALISMLSLFISADTGPMYIAEAFGIPTIDIVGPVKEFVQPPQGETNRVVFAPRARGMLGVLDNIAPNMNEARRQSEAISVEMVSKTIDELATLIKL